MSDELKIAVKTAKEAGKYVLSKFRESNEFEFKSSREIVTKIDLESEEIILKTIRKHFPEHAIHSEEQGHSKTESDCLWIVDPIDGTTNFSRGIPFFNVSIAFARQGKLEFGVVFDPFNRELFWAQSKHSAFLNDQSIRVSATKELSKSLFSMGRGTSDINVAEYVKVPSKLEKKVHSGRRLGSCALELCYVACGRLDFYFNIGSKVYDYAAGALIVQEAGGAVTDFNNKPYELNTKKILASNGRFHSEIINALKE